MEEVSNHDSMAQTIEWLQSVMLDGSGSSSSSSSSSKENIFRSLKSVLLSDGISLINKQGEHPLHHGRFLEEEKLEPHDKDFTLYVILVFICVLFAACASGLTQGLLSLDAMEMKIKAVSGTEEEKKMLPRLFLSSQNTTCFWSPSCCGMPRLWRLFPFF